MGRWGPIALHETDNNKQSPRETGKSKATPDLGKRSLHMGRSWLILLAWHTPISLKMNLNGSFRRTRTLSGQQARFFFGMIIMLQLRLSPNRAKCISVLLVAFHAATECTPISGYQAKRRSLQAICDNSFLPYLLSSESRGHFPSAITNPTRSSPLLAGVLDNISLELCEPFNPKSGTPRSLERQGEAGWSRAASRVIDFESYPQSSYESPSELDLLQFWPGNLFILVYFMQSLALGLKFPRKNRPVWFSKSEPDCDYGSIKTDPEPASREKGTLDSWQKACSFCPRSKGERWTLYLASTIWDFRWFRESVPQH